MREIPGAAISAVRIEGAAHPFILLDGVVEDVDQIVENLGKIRIRLTGAAGQSTLIDISGPGTVTAGDLARETDIQVADPSLIIATVIDGGQLHMTVEIGVGVGWESARDIQGQRPGWMEIDRDFSTVQQVSLDIEERTDGACLSLGIVTCGTLGPDEATRLVATSLAQRGEPDEPDPALMQAIARAASAPVLDPNGPDPRPVQPEVREICKTPPRQDCPDLLDLPRNSYEAFLQLGCAPGEREARGLEKCLRQAFPLHLTSGDQWSYEGYSLVEPDGCWRDCRRSGGTYAGEVTIHLRQAQGDETRDVPAGPIPLMTERSTFIISGQEKLVVGQLLAGDGEGPNDLAARCLRLVGDQLETSLSGPLAADTEAATRLSSIDEWGLSGFEQAVARFFSGGGLLRVVEGTNPLSLVSQARALVQQGVQRPGLRARDVHASHFGRVCLLETPEGEKIGLNLSAALHASVDEEGRLLTPYSRTDTDQIELLCPDDETDAVIADLGAGGEYLARYGGRTLARHQGEITRVDGAAPAYTPVHPSQALGASAGLLPLLGHDDANRALMATNMQKQAVPLTQTEAPLIRTGLETHVAGSSRADVRAGAAGTVTRVAADRIVVQQADGSREQTYQLTGFAGSSLGTCQRQRPLVRQGDEIAAGQTIATGPAIDCGTLALGRNVLVGYVSWEGANFEDSLVVSDRLVRQDVFTSIKVREFVATLAADAQPSQAFGAAHLPATETTQLSSEGAVREGAAVAPGDVLVARSKSAPGGRRDSSLRLPPGLRGTVVKVERYAAANGDPVDEGVAELIRITVAVRRRLKVGDKMANRHGGKGIVGRIVPEDEMPVMPDGRALDIAISPLGVPTRMNIGQLLETHLGLAAKALNCVVVTPSFNGADKSDVDAMLAEAGLPASGMFRLRDGRTGRQLEQESTVGYHYYMKLVHMVDDKLRVRSVGPGNAGKSGATHGGQRVGIMETWALQAHGAGHLLQEMLTTKSDDVGARSGTYEALVSGGDLPRPTVPDSVRRLALRLRGLCLDLRFVRADGEEMDIFEPGATVDEAAAVHLEYAAADTVRRWSTEQLLTERGGAGFDELFGSSEELGIKHLELAAEVEHPWRSLVGELGTELPRLKALPVLPRSLRADRKIDALYLAVCAANEATVRNGGDQEIEALQTAVDELMGDRGLTRLLYGKRGWFSAAMSGKRVDFSARTVVAPGFDLSYDECGLPRDMARSLFEPLVVGELIRGGHASSVDEATRLVCDDDPAATRLLEQLAGEKLVLLHRAPVLHRWGIQAFRPTVTDEDVLRLHPLTMATFNADFDGDEMDVFLPLSALAQKEAASMLPSANQVGLATGEYVNPPSQDMILGCYYATVGEGGKPPREFGSLEELTAAFDLGDLASHDRVSIPGNSGTRETTAGRALLNQLLPRQLPWMEGPVGKRELNRIMLQCWRELGPSAAARLGDDLMYFGFRLATRSGLSIGVDALPQYSRYDDRLAEAWQIADQLEDQAQQAAPDADGPADAVTDHWVEISGDFAHEALEELARDRDGLNPVHLMLTSGARGNPTQIKQHIAMRGLFATPDSRIIEAPCTTSFVRGHSPLEYLASTFGARKGLSDTALKTASAGFLFKRVVNAVHDILVTEDDCGTLDGVAKPTAEGAGRELMPLEHRLGGRTALEPIVLPGEDKPVVQPGELIGAKAVAAIAASSLSSITVRSPLTCKTRVGVCGKCYGSDLSRDRLAGLGMPVGLIAAHCMGEPMTQLTMRTFYLGTLARRRSELQGGEPPTIVSGLPRLDELFEAGRRPGGSASDERENLEAMLAAEGVLATAAYLMGEMVGIYRLQGVLIDDRHFEVIIRQMLDKVRITSAGDTDLEEGEIATVARLEAANSDVSGAGASEQPVVLGVSEVARATQDLIAAGTSYGGIPALARAAVRRQKTELNGIRSSTIFGKLIPARGAEAAARAQGE